MNLSQRAARRMRKKYESKYGISNGPYIRWHENGNKYQEGNMKYGKVEGMVTFYDKDGKKTSEQEYKNGKLEGITTNYFLTGAKESEYIYKNDKDAHSGFVLGLIDYFFRIKK